MAGQGPTDEERQAASDKLDAIGEKYNVSGDYLASHSANPQPNLMENRLRMKGFSETEIDIVRESSSTISADD